MGDSPVAGHRCVIPITGVRIGVSEYTWPFAMQSRADISNHWDDLLHSIPAMWNGTILMTCNVAILDGTFSASCFRSDYASFVAWRDWGWPDASVYNCFGSPLIHSNDGALIYGRMARHTLNAGLCYPPSGSLELADVRPDGSVDILDSIRRELAEETGLDAGTAAAGDLMVVFDEQRIAIAQSLHFDMPACEMAAGIRGFLAAQSDPELEDVVIIREAVDPDLALPDYAKRLAQHLLCH